METPSVVEYSIDAQIDVFDTQAFAENEVDAACEYAHTCNLGCHGRTHFRGIAILPSVTHLSLSTPLITTPHPLLPLSVKLP